MIDLFNEILESFQLFVSLFFNKLEFISGVSIGWIIVTITVISIIVRFFIGRLKE